MRYRIHAAVLVAALALAAGCGTISSVIGATRPSGGATAPARLPRLVGMGLQSAQDAARAAGFRDLTSHDALGRGRHQLLDRDWKVCFQTPATGEHPTSTQVALGVVMLEEDCPSKDGGVPSKAGGTMPDFRGKSLQVAQDTLDPSTSIDPKDVSGDKRNIFVETNWKICTQTPAPGAKLTGQPVTFGVVKFGEDCP